MVHGIRKLSICFGITKSLCLAQPLTQFLCLGYQSASFSNAHRMVHPPSAHSSSHHVIGMHDEWSKAKDAIAKARTRGCIVCWLDRRRIAAWERADTVRARVCVRLRVR